MRRSLSWLKPKPSYLPLAIGGSVLVISWFYLLWNTTAGELVPALRFRSKATIAGIVQETAPTLSLHAVLTGTYQQWVSRSIGKLSPVFKPAVRWKSQLYYTLLGTAGSDRVVVGKQQQLFELWYLDEYCSRNLALVRTKGEDWAARIRHMQGWFDARGKRFLYLITPSKVAQSPQFIPDGYACPAHAEDRARKLDVYSEILTRHGVRFVNTAATLSAAREEYGIDMFPRGGIHWNALAAALGTQQVIAATNAQRHGPALSTFRFTWKISYNPQEIDRDLLDIMNLQHPDWHYPVPELIYQSSPPASDCPTVKITEVGGSFLGSINSTLEKLACPPDITQWFYWDRKRIHYANGVLNELPVDAEARSQSLLNADIVFFEENEALGPDSKHGESMMQEVETLANSR